MPAFRATETVVSAAELARLRAIAAAVAEWRNASLDSVYHSYRLMCKLLDDNFDTAHDNPPDHDDPPAPLDTDEQISRLLRENEVMAKRLAEIIPETTVIRDKAKDIVYAIDRIHALASPHYLKRALAAK